MKPYYEERGIKIYCGDCREIAPPKSVDLLLTDPPYGIDLQTDYSRLGDGDVLGRDYIQLSGDKTVGDFKWLFDVGCLKVIFGANNWPEQIRYNPKTCGWICWDKRTNEEADRILGSPFELAVVIGRRSYEMIRLQHCGVENADGDASGRFHPTQKPVRLMHRIIKMFNPHTVFDPFMGSGTTLIAAKNLRCYATGIEIEEKYCEIAAKRLSQEVLDFSGEAK
jgi:DNA modification methylase